MTFENQPAPQSIEVEVLEVLPQEGAVVIKGPNGIEGKYMIVEPAKISYAQVGKATVKFSGENISYLRNTKQSGFGSNQQYNKPVYRNYQGYQRSSYNSYPRQSYQQANTYQQANPVVQQPVQQTRQILLFVEDVKGSSLAKLYNDIGAFSKIKATTLHQRVNVESEKIGENKEIIHMKYDAFVYIDLPTSISLNSLNRLVEEIDKKEEVEDY